LVANTPDGLSILGLKGAGCEPRHGGSQSAEIAAIVEFPQKVLLCIFNNCAFEHFAVQGGKESRFGKFEKGKSQKGKPATLANAL
jgi:hypothetical protein